MEDFKIGDLVILRSGGPVMTVASAGVNGVHCTWFARARDEWATGLASAIIAKEMLSRAPSIED